MVKYLTNKISKRYLITFKLILNNQNNVFKRSCAVGTSSRSVVHFMLSPKSVLLADRGVINSILVERVRVTVVVDNWNAKITFSRFDLLSS